MLYLHNDIFLTDIIGYDRLKVSYTPKWNRGYASGTGVATNWGGHFHHSLARGSLPKIDADAVSLHGKCDPTDIELVASRHWFQTGRLLTCWNCLQFHPPHTLHPQWGETPHHTTPIPAWLRLLSNLLFRPGNALHHGPVSLSSSRQWLAKIRFAGGIPTNGLAPEVQGSREHRLRKGGGSQECAFWGEGPGRDLEISPQNLDFFASKLHALRAFCICVLLQFIMPVTITETTQISRWI